MVVAKVRVAVDDPLVAERFDLRPECVKTPDEAFFLDGPVSARVAVLDRSPETGRLATPVAWSEGAREYVVPEDATSPEATSVSVLGLVLKTLALFEREDVLGHRVK